MPLLELPGSSRSGRQPICARAHVHLLEGPRLDEGASLGQGRPALRMLPGKRVLSPRTFFSLTQHGRKQKYDHMYGVPTASNNKEWLWRRLTGKSTKDYQVAAQLVAGSALPHGHLLVRQRRKLVDLARELLDIRG